METEPKYPKKPLRRPPLVADVCWTPVPIGTANRSSTVVLPPGECIATRMPPARSRRSTRGYLVGGSPLRSISYASVVERDHLMLLLADPAVRDVIDQPRKLPFRGFDGSPFEHTFDYLTLYRSGRMRFVLCKRWAEVERDEWVSRLEHMSPQLPPHVADGIDLRTERNVCPVALRNARLVLAVRLDEEDPMAERAVMRAAKDWSGPLSIGDLSLTTGDRHDRFRTVVRLVDKGRLARVGTGLLCHSTILRVAS